jgi:hypothetical protein
MRALRPVVLSFVLLIGLPACSGDGGGGTPSSIGPIHCAELSGGTATVSLACTAGSCTSDFHEGAVDGDLDTYAILSMTPDSNGSVSIRSTAADGVTYPAGTPAAVVYGIKRGSANSLNTTETIRTYLDGVLQETGNAGPINVSFGGDTETGRRAIETQLDFDAIELTYTQTGGTADVEVQVHEFCTSVN